MKRLLQMALVVVIVSLMFACGKQKEEPLPSLTYQQREIVDTLYMEQVAELRPILDSICEAEHAGRVARAVDSLIKVRKEEEARLRARILQEQSNQ